MFYFRVSEYVCHLSCSLSLYENKSQGTFWAAKNIFGTIGNHILMCCFIWWPMADTLLQHRLNDFNNMKFQSLLLFLHQHWHAAMRNIAHCRVECLSITATSHKSLVTNEFEIVAAIPADIHRRLTCASKVLLHLCIL